MVAPAESRWELFCAGCAHRHHLKPCADGQIDLRVCDSAQVGECRWHTCECADANVYNGYIYSRETAPEKHTLQYGSPRRCFTGHPRCKIAVDSSDGIARVIGHQSGILSHHRLQIHDGMLYFCM